MGGILAGLGMGLMGAGQTVSRDLLAGEEMKRRAQQDALQNAIAQQQLSIQQEAQRRLADQADFTQAQFGVSNLPANTPLDTSTVDKWTHAGLGAFIRPDMTGDVANTPVQDGLPNVINNPDGTLGGSIGNPLVNQTPTGRGYSIPTEDSKARTAAMNNALKNQQFQAKLMQTQQLAAAANALKAQLAGARNEIDRQRIGAQLAAVQATMARIGQDARQFDAMQDWRYDVQAPNIDFDNALGQFRADNPTAQSGGIDLGQVISAIQGGQGGATPPTGSPANPALPTPGAKRPPAPSAKPSAPRRKAYSDGSVAEEEIGPDGKPTGKWIQVTPPKK